MVSRKPKDIWRSLCRKRYVAPRRLNQVALAHALVAATSYTPA